MNGHHPYHLIPTQQGYSIITDNENLKGTVPQCFGDMRNLRGLALSNNKLHGDLPRFRPNKPLSLFLNNNFHFSLVIIYLYAVLFDNIYPTHSLL